MRIITTLHTRKARKHVGNVRCHRYATDAASVDVDGREYATSGRHLGAGLFLVKGGDMRPCKIWLSVGD